MRKLFLIPILLFILMLTSSLALAQGSSVVSDDHTAQEEAEGKEIWDKLQAKQLECKDLTNDNYAVLGEYFMGQSIGNTQRHAAMNQMMTSMMGEEGEEQMHIVMGKRLSSCDTGTKGGGNPMMGNLGQSPMGWFGFASWLVTLTWIVWLAVGILAAIWLWKQITKKNLKKL